MKEALTISEFHDRIGRLSERERVRMLHAIDELIPKFPSAHLAEVEAEIAELRRARHGGRRTRVE